MIEDLLLTPKEYKELDISPTYFFEIENNGKVLYFFGANHSYNPKNYQYDQIREKWDEFLDKTKERERVVLIEGGKGGLLSSEEESIKHGAESRFTTFLAFKEGIEVLSPEPNQKEEVQKMLNDFSEEEVVYYYFARLVDQFYRQDVIKDIDKFFEPYIRRFNRLFGHKKFNFEYLKKLHLIFFDKNFEVEDKDFFHKISNPTNPDFSQINKVAELCSKIRNTKIISEIARLWGEGKNIFVIFGMGHAYMQEKALRQLLN